MKKKATETEKTQEKPTTNGDKNKKVNEKEQENEEETHGGKKIEGEAAFRRKPIDRGHWREKKEKEQCSWATPSIEGTAACVTCIM
jgi:hypothetical protein